MTTTYTYTVTLPDGHEVARTAASLFLHGVAVRTEAGWALVELCRSKQVAQKVQLGLQQQRRARGILQLAILPVARSARRAPVA
jgi:hypothetical protein